MKIYDAAREGNLEEVNKSLKGGANVDERDPNYKGETALIWASYKGHFDVAKHLITCKADVNAKSDLGRTALIYASYSGHLDVAKHLITCKADVNAKTNNGSTALIYASNRGRFDVAKHLITCKADVNAKYDLGRTALIGASHEGHFDVAKHLITCKADVNAKNNDGDTAKSRAYGEVKEKWSVLEALARAVQRGDEPTSTSASTSSESAPFLLGPLPEAITTQISNTWQRHIQGLVSGSMEAFYTEVIISYATGKREQDANGTGPGMHLAASVVTALNKHDIPCFSGLCIDAGDDWRKIHLRINGRRSKCKVFVALQTRAYFQSIPCLEEMHNAVERGAYILPVRVEEDLPKPRDQWLDIKTDEEELMLETVQSKVAPLNHFPPRGTLLNQEGALDELIEKIKTKLATL